ncbi:hypothetical protein BDV96DRAFT_647562 [Lophiotrema nucula]|uniref:NACHT domain-containing protein n=1 Tax=Lophiotrema nucula TaxID=690887 RepID=A0A6A5Z4Q5_9PLEO|nr:hypothetical protein BDV96DRAFT_647562 [Lophiotrema nucula]
MATSATVPTTQDQVDRARAAFQSLPRDNILFQQCLTDQITLESVFAHLQKKSFSHKRKLSTRTLDRFQRCTGWMLNISRSIDVAVNASAGIACPVWAPIKFVLMISKDDSTALEEIISMIDNISDNLPRLELYERFRDEPSFQAVLVDLFADMADFATQVHQFLSRRTFARLGLLVKRNFRDRFGRTISEIERRTKTADSTAIALHQLRTERLLQENQAKSRNNDRIRLMQWLNSPNIQECYERTFSAVVETTCEWFLDHPSFFAWMDQQSRPIERRILVAHGGAGSGKSVLSAFVYHILRRRPDGYADEHAALARLPTEFAAFFFPFAIDDLGRQSLASLVRSMLSQLLEYDTSENLLELIDMLTLKSSVSTSELQETLCKACLALSRPVFIVLDGIDEHSGTSDELLQKLLELVEAVPNIHMVLFGQSHAFAKFLLSTSNIPSIHIVPELTRRDMETVINAGVIQCRSFWDDSLRRSVAESLLAQVDGMFLYARLMLDYLKKIASFAEVHDCLRELPSGLERTYELLLNRLVQRLEDHCADTVLRILSLVVCSGRPLALEELRLAYALVSEPGSSLDPSETIRRLLILPPEELVELCGGVLTYADGRIHLVHSSLRTFLTSRPFPRCINDPRLPTSLQVDAIATHRVMSNICIKVFRYADKFSKEHHLGQKCWEPLWGYARLYFAYHFNTSGRSVNDLEQILDLLTKSRNLASLIFGQDLLYDDSMPDILLENFLMFDSFIGHGEGMHATTHIPEALQAFEEHLLETFKTEVHEDDTQDTLSMIGTYDEGSRTDVQEESSTNRAPSIDTSPASSMFGLDRLFSSRSQRTHHSGMDFHQLSGRFDTHMIQAHRVIYGAKFDLALKLVRRLLIGTLQFKDPLKVAWDWVMRIAKSASPLLLSALTAYLMWWGRFEEVLEVGKECHEKLKSQKGVFRLGHEWMMGFVARGCRQYTDAISYHQSVLEGIDEYPAVRQMCNVSYIYLYLSDSYMLAGQISRSLGFVRTMFNARSIKDLETADVLSFYYIAGRTELAEGVLQQGVNHLRHFKALCHHTYPDLGKVTSQRGPLHRLVSATWKLGLVDLDSGRVNDALAAIQEVEDILATTKISWWGTAELKSQMQSGYRSLVSFQRYLEEGRESLVDHIQQQCHSSKDCRECFVALRDQMGAVQNCLRHSKQLRKLLEAWMKHFEIYKDVHRETPQKDLAGEIRFWHYHDFGTLYNGEYYLNKLVGDYQKAQQSLLKSLEYGEKACPGTGAGQESVHRVLAGMLSDLARLQCRQGNREVAIESSRVASHIVSNLPESEKKDRLRKKVLKRFRISMGITTSQISDLSGDEEERIVRLVRKQTRHLSSRPLRQAYRGAETLLDPEQWQAAMCKYANGRETPTIEERSVEVLKDHYSLCCGDIFRRHYANGEEYKPHQCKTDMCCNYHCNKEDYSKIIPSQKGMSTILLESIGLIFGPHIPCPHLQRNGFEGDFHPGAFWYQRKGGNYGQWRSKGIVRII